VLLQLRGHSMTPTESLNGAPLVWAPELYADGRHSWSLFTACVSNADPYAPVYLFRNQMAGTFSAIPVFEPRSTCLHQDEYEYKCDDDHDGNQREHPTRARWRRNGTKRFATT